MALYAIDGPAGAGKTTYAATLEAELATIGTVKVIHMDDLYSGWENALSDELAALLVLIAKAHLAKEEFVIKKFNWHTMEFGAEESVAPTDFLIIEGVGAAQEVMREAGAKTYWLDIEAKIGLQRVLKRDGAQIEAQMRQWQIDQEKHFTLDQTRNNCEFKLTS